MSLRLMSAAGLANLGQLEPDACTVRPGTQAPRIAGRSSHLEAPRAEARGASETGP